MRCTLDENWNAIFPLSKPSEIEAHVLPETERWSWLPVLPKSSRCPVDQPMMRYVTMSFLSEHATRKLTWWNQLINIHLQFLLPDSFVVTYLWSRYSSCCNKLSAINGRILHHYLRQHEYTWYIADLWHQLETAVALHACHYNSHQLANATLKG